MLIKAEARVDRVGIAELASVEGASGTISQGGMVAVAGGQWDEHGGSSMPFGWAGDAAWCATLSLYPTCIYLHWVRSAGGSPGVLTSPDPPPRPRTSGGDKRGIRSRKGDKIANVSPGQRLLVKSGHFGSFGDCTSKVTLARA